MLANLALRRRSFCRTCTLLLLASTAAVLPLRPGFAQNGADDDVPPSPEIVPVSLPKASSRGYTYDNASTELYVIQLPGDHGRPINTEDRPVKTMTLARWPNAKKGEDGNWEYGVHRSPSGRYALLDWKIAVGVNGMILFRRDASGAYRRTGQGKTFNQRAADNAGTTGSSRYARENYHKNDDGWFVNLTGWHGVEDRYLDFELDEDHGPVIWRGSYDVVQDRFIEVNPPVFGPNGPRAKGELFPETRTRLLTDADVAHLSYAKVRYAINEIYARHGFRFDGSPAIQKHFESLDWYRRDDDCYRESQVEPRLTANERANLKVLGRRRDALMQKNPVPK